MNSFVSFSLSLLLLLAAAFLPAGLPGQGSWGQGYWHPTSAGWPSTFEAVNMAVIPNDGRVIVWDLNIANQNIAPTSPWPQRFAVGDPELLPATTAFTNRIVPIPAGYGDLFCSGHVWLPNGRLFVAGGNTRYPSTGANYFEGSRFAAIWNPADLNNQSLNYGWSWLPPMHRKRWYPTVTLFIDSLGNPRVMVSGGVESTASEPCNGVPDAAFNTYEVWNIAGGAWERDPNQVPPLLEYNGPSVGTGCYSVLGEYPRMHLVSTNRVFLSGMFTGSNRVRHLDTSGPTPTPQNWVASPWNNLNHRSYGSSVLLPNVGNTQGGRDLIMILGGYAKYNNGGPGNTTSFDTCQIIDGGATTFLPYPNAWTLSPHTMRVGRMCANVVLLPNGEVLALGGCNNNYFQQGITRATVYAAEVFNQTTGWRFDSNQGSPREYHSTAVLLPSGKVVSAGGDTRSSDYEVFTPDYLAQGQTRPAFAGTWGNPGYMILNWGTDYGIEHDPLPCGCSISRVVLMRPCSVTHHSDMDQRYVELANVPQPDSDAINTVVVRTPNTPTGGNTRGSTEAPPGWYMAFLITSEGTPSMAKWVLLQ